MVLGDSFRGHLTLGWPGPHLQPLAMIAIDTLFLRTLLFGTQDDT